MVEMGQAEAREWFPPRISALVRLKHEECYEMQTSLSYGMRPCLRNEGKTLKGLKKQPDGKGKQPAGGEQGRGRFAQHAALYCSVYNQYALWSKNLQKNWKLLRNNWILAELSVYT